MNGYFQDWKGNKSSTRLIGFIVTMFALIESMMVLIFAYLEGTSVMTSAVAGGTVFASIAGPVMVYLFQNKKEELKKEQV